MINREARLGVIPQSRMDLLAELEERVLCGDGAMGTLLQLQRAEENIERSTLNIE